MGFKDRIQNNKAAAPVTQQANGPRFSQTRVTGPRNPGLYEGEGEYELECLGYKRVNQYSIFEFIVREAREGSALREGDRTSHMIDRTPPANMGGTELAFKNLQSVLYPLLGVDTSDEAAMAAALSDPATDDIPNELDGFGKAYGEELAGKSVHVKCVKRTNKNGVERIYVNFYPLDDAAAA